MNTLNIDQLAPLAYSSRLHNSVVETETYLAAARKIMSQPEMENVVAMISADPKSGDVIPASKGLRKLRIPLQGRGKRGGGRVIYWFYNEGYPAVLLWAYAKNAANDLTPSQRKSVTAIADNLLDEFRSFQ